MGENWQQRPSRSPRNQRSRSADVDCLKKYTERRVEERRHTEISDTSKLDTARWMPLSKNTPRCQQSAVRRSSRDERQTNINELITDDGKRLSSKSISSTTEQEQSSSRETAIVYRQITARSHSTDVTPIIKSEKRIIGERRHTDCSDPQIIATRWMPQVNETKFRQESSPLARNECEITRTASRWMTFSKNPSPGPIPRINPERRTSITERSGEDKESRKDLNTYKWQSPKKFSPVKYEKGRLQRQDELDYGRDRSPSYFSYDFKTENEWSQRTESAERENKRVNNNKEARNNYRPIRRNSQDLEFNDRIDICKSRTLQERNQWRSKCDDANDVFADDLDERLRKFNDKLRYSEDFSTEQMRFRERRTYSDDYDEKIRRESRSSGQAVKSLTRRRMDMENKRTSDMSFAKSRESCVSYVEVDFVKRDSRISDASYVSINNVSKRGSMECKSARQILEVPARRAFSENNERPATPVPPIEWNDEPYVAKKLQKEHRQSDNTRYKVYLT